MFKKKSCELLELTTPGRRASRSCFLYTVSVPDLAAGDVRQLCGAVAACFPPIGKRGKAAVAEDGAKDVADDM